MEDYRLFKTPTISGTHLPQNCYCILRIDKGFHSTKDIQIYEKHMERKMQVPNANSKISNLIVIGGKDISDDVDVFLQGVKLRKNSVIARSILLTASPSFFSGLTEDGIYKWIEENRAFLEKEYGSNVVYMSVHFDETTPHINALIVPIVEKDGKRKLSSKAYFNGPTTLRLLQDRYAEHMFKAFPVLKRGVRYSKAKHTDIKYFYGVLNGSIKAQDNDLNVKKGIILETLLKRKESHLNAYKSNYDKVCKENDELKKANEVLKGELQELKKDREQFKDTLRRLSMIYNIPSKSIDSLIKSLGNRKITSDKELERK